MTTTCPARDCRNVKHPRDFLCVPHLNALPWPVRQELNVAGIVKRIGGGQRRLESARRAALECAHRIRVEHTVYAI